MRVVLVLIGFLLIGMLGLVSALSISVHVPEKYTDVEAGERFYFEIDIKYPENPARKDLRLEYEIFDENSNLVSQAKALKAVEAQASFIDFIVIPESVESGIHFINVNVRDYEGLSEEVGASFYVSKVGADTVRIYLIAILVAIVFVGIIVVIGIVTRKR